MSILERICVYLQENNVSPIREVHHEPTKTSEESARARGEELKIGGKALLIKIDSEFRLFILSANRKLNNKAIKSHFSASKTRFATPAELMELTGLVPGSVPPFGQPILPFPLYVDPSVLDNARIAFNAGSLTDSIVLFIEDYKRIMNASEMFPFSTEE